MSADEYFREFFKQAAAASGGKAILSVDGSFTEQPDVAVVVFGETPYAEGQGDVQTLAWQSDSHGDLKLIQQLKAQGIPVVAVLLTKTLRDASAPPLTTIPLAIPPASYAR